MESQEDNFKSIGEGISPEEVNKYTTSIVIRIDGIKDPVMLQWCHLMYPKLKKH